MSTLLLNYWILANQSQSRRPGSERDEDGKGYSIQYCGVNASTHFLSKVPIYAYASQLNLFSIEI